MISYYRWYGTVSIHSCKNKLCSSSGEAFFFFTCSCVLYSSGFSFRHRRYIRDKITIVYVVEEDEFEERVVKEEESGSVQSWGQSIFISSIQFQFNVNRESSNSIYLEFI